MDTHEHKHNHFFLQGLFFTVFINTSYLTRHRQPMFEDLNNLYRVMEGL
jgi:hypothetical protein